MTPLSTVQCRLNSQQQQKNEKQMFAVQTRPACGGIIVVNPLKSSYIRWDDLSSSPFAVGGGEPVMMIKFSARRS